MLPPATRNSWPPRLLTLLGCFLAWPTSAGAAAPDGARIYAAACARCHGKTGEGTKRYKSRLEGDRSVAQLADLIRKTMPENNPGSLSAEEARAVAAHVHDSFYSRVARERNRPARATRTLSDVGDCRGARR